MLILKRKKNESIIIGDSIEIKVTDVQGDSVKLGISAPRSVSIYREEIYRQIREQNIQAAGMPHDAIDDIQDLLKDS